MPTNWLACSKILKRVPDSVPDRQICLPIGGRTLEAGSDHPTAVAAAFREWRGGPSPDRLIGRAIEIPRVRFSGDETPPGARKDGPTNYARFLADPGRPDLAPLGIDRTRRRWSSSSSRLYSCGAKPRVARYSWLGSESTQLMR